MFRSPAEVTAESTQSLQLSSQAQQALRDGALHVEVVDEGQAKKLTVSVDWLNRSGQRQSHPALHAWRYAPQEVQE